jgi:hypothetical protein
VERPGWAPHDVDLDRPSAARVYDYFLGGAHHFDVDRQLAAKIESLTPNVAASMRANREFLRRAVRFLVAEGIDQFLDLGSGIPTVGNVHEVALRANPDARIVYVDVDAVAVSHSRAILGGRERIAVLQADVRDPAEILASPEVRGTLDLDRPVGVLMLAVLHYVVDGDDPTRIAHRFRDAVAPGSHLAISHATTDGQPQEFAETQTLSRQLASPITFRPRQQVLTMFDGLDLVDPGLVYLPLWRPDSPQDAAALPEQSGAYGGVARKPG